MLKKHLKCNFWKK